MTLTSIVIQELKARPWSLLSSAMAIGLGVAALVAVRHVTIHAEAEVKEQLATLGANILVLPKEATLQDFYSADKNGGTVPEEHVAEIWMAGLAGVEKVSPKLNVPASLGDRQVTLTGILPQEEFTAQSAWQSMALASPKKHNGCTKTSDDIDDDKSPEALVTTRAIQTLGKDEVVLGADVAERCAQGIGDSVRLLDGDFRIVGVLSRTGTVDDSRVFAHLHSVQDLSHSGQVVNAIEIIGCCKDAAGDLVPDLRKLLPDTKVVTISQVVQTQVGVNRLMANTSWFILGILVLVGGATLAGAIAANVRERRREIGTLMALGATPSFVLRMFLGKALILGLVAGCVGGVVGMLVATLFGRQWTGIPVSPLPGTTASALVVATLLAALAAYWPARQASRIDPCLCFQEV